MKHSIIRFLYLVCILVLFLSPAVALNVSAATLVNPYATFACTLRSAFDWHRCYAYDEQYIPNILGSQTKLVIVPLARGTRYPGVPGAGAVQLVGDTMWFVDDSTKNGSCSNNICWIEMGETVKSITPGGVQGTYAYWADNRPQIAACFFILCQYREHPMGTLRAFGGTTLLSMYYVSPGTWQVRATGAVNFSQQSTNNVMVPDLSRFGSELAGSGTSGVDAGMPTTTFSGTQYLLAGSPIWHYINSDGLFSGDDGFPDNPPWGGWRTHPSSGGGGVWYTCIKASKWNGSQYPNPC